MCIEIIYTQIEKLLGNVGNYNTVFEAILMIIKDIKKTICANYGCEVEKTVITIYFYETVADPNVMVYHIKQKGEIVIAVEYLKPQTGNVAITNEVSLGTGTNFIGFTSGATYVSLSDYYQTRGNVYKVRGNKTITGEVRLG